MSEYIKSSSPYKSVQGAGRGLRPTADDLGKTKKGSEAEIRKLMAPQAKVNKFSGQPKVINKINT